MKKQNSTKDQLGNDPQARQVQEEREMVKLLDLPEEAFTIGKLQYVEPETWKNVGASLVHAVRILKDH